MFVFVRVCVRMYMHCSGCICEKMTEWNRERDCYIERIAMHKNENKTKKSTNKKNIHNKKNL